MRNFVIAGAALLVTACATSAGAQRANLAVTLNGLQEVPGPGDPDGIGTAEIRVQPGQGRLCWNLYVRQTDAAVAAHLHRGARRLSP